MTYIPREMFGHFFEGFDPDTAEDCANMETLPDIHFHVKGATSKEDFVLVLEPKDYVIKYTNDSGADECVMGISPDDEVDYLITIGQEILRAFTTIFDFGERRIGFYDMSLHPDKKLSKNDVRHMKAFN